MYTHIVSDRLERRVKAMGAGANDTSKEAGGMDKVGIEQNVPGTNIHAAAGKMTDTASPFEGSGSAI